MKENKIKLKRLNRLSEKQRSEIRNLEEQCRFVDRTENSVGLNASINAIPYAKCFFLLYFETLLAGFAELFFPTECAVEISGFILPSERKKGLFKKILSAVYKELDKHRIEDVLFVHESSNRAALPAIYALGGKYDSSDYFMKYDFEENSQRFSQMNFSKVILKKLALGDELIASELLENIFEIPSELADEHIFEIFSDAAEQENNPGEETAVGYFIYQKEVLIGICSLLYTSVFIMIFDFGILPDYQRKGFGKAALVELLNKSEERKKPVMLHVSSHNKPAVCLYMGMGFQIAKQQDYYVVKRF